MDEVMGQSFDTTLQKNKPLYKSPRFIILMVILLSILASIGLSYSYSYYENSQSSKTSQVKVQQQLSQLLSSSDTVEYDWMRTLNPKAKTIEGGIIWSQKQQKGVMKFKNLPALSEKQQYHLWLYDRNAEQPISGRIFRQNSFDTNSRLVQFRPQAEVTSLYKFILNLENIDGNAEQQILLRIQP